MPLRVANKREAQKLLQLRLDDAPPDEIKPKRKLVREEAEHQRLLFAHRREMLPTYPQLRWLYSTLNGIFLPPHLRHQAIEAGMEPGVLDVYLPLRHTDPDGTVYSGLALDLKTPGKGRPAPAQLEWARHLAAQGWRVYFPEGAWETWVILCAFLGIAGAHHWAADLQQREAALRRQCQMQREAA